MPSPEFGSADNLFNVLVADDNVWSLAADILDGEIEPYALYPLPTDQIAYNEACATIRSTYSVTQAQVEQAIARAKVEITRRSGSE